MSKYEGRPCQKGHTLRYKSTDACVECQSIRSAKYRKTTKQAYDPEYSKEYRSRPERREKDRALLKRYYESNKEKHLAQSKEYRQSNKKRVATNSILRQKRLKQATLPGFNHILKAIWNECPEGYEVDHIEPLKGKDRSGLNVPWNLQYLNADENHNKSNKTDWISEDFIEIDYEAHNR